MSHLSALFPRDVSSKRGGTRRGLPGLRCGDARRALLLSAHLSCLLACASAALGEEPEPADDPAYDLGEIVVTAQRAYPACTVAQITARQMQEQGVTTVSEALELMPGVSVSAGGRKNEVAVHVRGANPRGLLVLVDGRPVNMPYYGEVDLNTIPVENVSRIEVHKGPASLLGGTNGTAAVVNIITGAPTARSDRLYASVGANSTYRLQVATGGKTRRWDYYATASRHRSDGFSLSDDFEPTALEDGGVRDNSDFDRLNLTAKLGCRVAGDSRLGVSLGCYHEDRGIPTSRDSPHSRFVDWNRYSVAGSAQTPPNARWGLEAQAFYDGFVNRLIDYTDARYDPGFISEDSTHDNWNRGLIFRSRLQLRGHALGAVCNALQQVINRKDTKNPWETFETVRGALAFEDVFTVPGLPITVFGGLSPSFLRAQDAADGHLGSWSVDGTLGTRLFLGDHLSLRGSVGRYTRYPTMHELYSGNRGSVTVDGVMLEPEEALKFEWGADLSPTAGLTLGSALFADQYRNLIDDSRGTFRNISRTHARGLECRLACLPPRLGAVLDVSYTFTDARDERTDKALPFVSKHEVDTSVTARAGWGGAAHLGAKWVGRRAQELGAPLDGYFVLGCRASYAYRRLTTALVMDNLFDESYSTEEADYPMPGRTIRLELALETGG